MRVRWIGLALVLALVGAAAGYGLGVLLRSEPTTFASAHPVPAVSPSIPIEPTPSYAPDIDYPALETGLTYKQHRIGNPPYEWEYDVPKGWTSFQEGFFEVRWRPEGEPTVGGYSLRVKIINQHESNEQMVAEKKAALTEIYEDDVTFTGETGDRLSFSYRDAAANKLRYNTFQWFTPTGGATAEFEMSVVGRAVDRAGLEDLLDHVAASIHKRP
ncbi:MULTISPECIES: hypothetical protein [unclassified Nocardioides]|uniref:hypothetical protein n=1 Tax=unclassified Nocardioides TaxID=2615069 RepID=UPI000A26F42D|nr:MULTISPECIES: hypothetical protein [unclassified Nocardioides]